LRSAHHWYAVGYDSSVVVYKWFHPKENAVQFDPGGKELPVMVIHDFILEDCSYNDTFSESSQTDAPFWYRCYTSVYSWHVLGVRKFPPPKKTYDSPPKKTAAILYALNLIFFGRDMQ